jgi:hypothetical protein
MATATKEKKKKEKVEYWHNFAITEALKKRFGEMRNVYKLCKQ